MKLPISLEFFPPKTPEGVAKLAAARAELYGLEPEFCSVTYGAGGSTQGGTLQTVRAILGEGRAGVPHVSCVGTTREGVGAMLDGFRAEGIRRLVALRGDLPSGAVGYGDLRHASDLVALVRELGGDHFHVEVACYPETHPQARSPQADLEAFATKVRAGANSAITQMFFNPDAYFRFVDEVRKMGLDIPIVPGIMPITNSSGLMRFADNCGCEIPRWVRLRLQSFGDDAKSIREFGLDVMTGLCERLVQGGVPGLHVYTMNQSGPTLALCRRLG
ncbi:MAG TPA: methylenetetrahydrofolate reductase [NAD(P)H] [Burkholderiaceae bacterium]|jgi:methylenetetrahydrofolate reductase (NADPH)|nr:methylenetetrahydrofolate reductase [NAD(P)H] [Burkholderiaceae bacterium]